MNFFDIRLILFDRITYFCQINASIFTCITGEWRIWKWIFFWTIIAISEHICGGKHTHTNKTKQKIKTVLQAELTPLLHIGKKSSPLCFCCFCFVLFCFSGTLIKSVISWSKIYLDWQIVHKATKKENPLLLAWLTQIFFFSRKLLFFFSKIL